ncbi:unnamed protein product [Urochloa decumbens]|uniref:Peptide transporter PTR2 n=1 Tax=Urochloa decumbens TaxID=240449 RepID=A0ABC8VK26_9POAL
MELGYEERHLLLEHQRHHPESPKHAAARRGSWRACVLILATELSETLAFAGIARNLVSYLTGELQESNAGAARDLSMWTGACFLTPLVGAFLADSYWGRYTTIVVFMSVYIMGMITLTLSASLPTLWSMGLRRAVVYLGLYLVAFGIGGIKPCVCPFGAEQFGGDNDADPAQTAAKASLFNWCFFCTNIGSMLASTLLVWVQDRVGWSPGFGIPAVVMAVALAVFVGNKRLYHGLHDQKPRGSPLTGVCQVLVAAARKRGAELPGDDIAILHDKLPDGYSHRMEHTNGFKFLDKAAAVVPGDVAHASPWRLSTVTQVEEVKTLLRLSTTLPTVVFFFAVTAQMSSTFVEQGAAMDTRVVDRFAVPPAALSSLEVTSILLCIPAYEAVLLPLARRITGNGPGLTQLRRLGVGLALSTLTMAYMAMVETRRLSAAERGVSISIVWQAPAYLVLGMAEVFTSVGLLEFYYDQSPDAMKSLCTAVSLVAVAAGNYLNSAIVAVVAWATTWIPQDLNRGRLDCFFWMMAGLSGINLLAFICSSMRYKYREKC